MPRNTFARIALLAILFPVGASGAADGYDAYDRAAGYGVDTLEKRVEKLERKLSGPALSGISEEVDKLQSEVLRLRGELEKTNNELNRVKKAHKDEYAAQEERLQQLGKGQSDMQAQLQSMTPQPAASAPGLTADGSVPPVAPPSDPSAVSPGAIAPTGVPPDPNAVPGSVPGQAPVPQREAAYQKAFTTLKEGKYPEAIRELKAFLSAYPNGEYSDNAQYWLAEAYYVTKDPAAARSAFDTVIRTYPQSSKVADAMLKLGFIDYDIGQFEQARATLNEVVRSYPNSSAAKLAEKRLEKMKQEGR